MLRTSTSLRALGMSRFTYLSLAAMLWSVLAMACQSEGAWIDDPLSPYPETLGEVGIYRDITTGEVDARAFRYTPRYPLYSNGLDKERFVVLPGDERIDVSGDPFVYPVGTLFFKTFWYATEDEARIPVETRILRARRRTGITRYTCTAPMARRRIWRRWTPPFRSRSR